MNVAVIGTGYVGLVAGASLSDMGNHVICVDKDIDKIEKLRNGILPIYEPELEEIISHNTSRNFLTFSTELKSSVEWADVCFIAVGTPQSKDGSANLQFVFEVAKEIGGALNGYKVIVNKSNLSIPNYRSTKNVAFPNKVCNEGIFWFVINICRRANLLN